MIESAFKKLVSDWYVKLTNADNVQDGENVNGKHCTDEMMDELEGILERQSPQRVTEQDAREIYESAVNKRNSLTFGHWLELHGRALLAKLNDKAGIAYKAEMSGD